MKVTIDATIADAMRALDRVPANMKKESDVFIDRVGYKLEAESKRAAPVVSGNLRRSIIYSERKQALDAHANYSKYVHGAPFYKNRMKRRETPFITTAIGNSTMFITQEARALLRRVIQ